MKLSILQQDLLPALQAVSRSVGVRSTLPVLANVLIQAAEGNIRLSATNLELGIVKKVAAEVTEEGDITIPAKILLEVVSSLPTEKLEIESSGEQLKISSKNSNSVLNGIQASEFPAIPLSSELVILVDSKVLKQAVPQIAFAAAADEGRPILTGVLTEIKRGQLELVATDGFRLSHKTAKIDTNDEVTFKAIIPRRTFEEVVRLIGEDLMSSDDKIEMSASENQNQMIFKIGQTQLSSRLIEGQFPSWEKIIPASYVNRMEVERVELLKAVKLASVFARDAANVLKIEVGDTSHTNVKVSAQAKEFGGQVSEVDARIAGEPVSIAFNSKFLSEALSACGSPQVSIEFSGNVSPALIKPVGEEGLEYVIMPIRLS